MSGAGPTCQFAVAVQQLANALRASGITDGERVAYLAGNSAEMLIAHYAAPLARGVLVAINTRLTASEIGYIIRHSGARILFGDSELIEGLPKSTPISPLSANGSCCPQSTARCRTPPTRISYAQFLTRGDDADLPWEIDDETRTIAINYTSGTTGRPKESCTPHRGAYLSALSGIHHSGFTQSTRYLWTLPMFHCNGWCATWGVTAALGTHYRLRSVRAETVWGSRSMSTTSRISAELQRFSPSWRTPSSRTSWPLRSPSPMEGPTEPHHHRRHASAGRNHRAHVRSHRDLRPVRSVRAAARMGTI